MLEKPILGENQNGEHQLAELADMLSTIELGINHLRKSYRTSDLDYQSLRIAQCSTNQALSSIVHILDRHTEAGRVE